MKPKTKILVLIVTVIAFCSIVVATLFGLNTFGVLRLFETPISIKIEDYTTTYNAEKVEADFPYQITSGGLLTGDNIEISTKKEVINAGEYTDCFDVKILDRNGQNVTSSYNLSLDVGILEVLPVEITLKSATAVFPDDGSDHGDKGVSTIKGRLLNNDYLEFSGFKTFNTKGFHENTFSAKIFTEDSKEVTKNYDISYQYGYIIITNVDESQGGSTSSDEEFPEKVEVNQGQSGNNTVQVDIDDTEFKDYGTAIEPAFTYTPTKVGGSLFVDFALGVYTGKDFLISENQYKPKYGVNPHEFISDLLRNSKREFSGILTYKDDSYKNRDFDYAATYPILDSLQNQDSYTICDLSSDTVEIKGYNFDYFTEHSLIDDVSFSNENYVNEELEYRKFVYENYMNIPNSTKSVIDDFIAEKDLNGDSLLDSVQRIINLFKSEYLYNISNLECYNADDYVVSFLTDTKIGKCDIFASAGAIILRALGYPTRVICGYGMNGECLDKIYYNPTCGHAQCQVYIDGKGWVTFEFTVAPMVPGCVMPPNLPPTYNSDVEFDITIGTNDVVKEYDGKVLSSTDDDVIVNGKLKDNHQLIYSLNNTLYNAGEIENKPFYMIIDENFNDVTDEYKVKEDFGNLMITKRELIIETENISITFDGEPLEVKFKSKGLASGDKISAYISNSLTNKGMKEAIVIIKAIANSKDEVVTGNYDIKYIYGYLKVE